MDHDRFDDLMRWLADAASRRAALQTLAASALAAGLGLLGREEAAAKCNKTGKKCTRDKQCCSGSCRRRKCRCSNAGGKCTSTDDCCGDLGCLRIGAICQAPAP